MILVGAKGHAKDILSDTSFFKTFTKKYVFDDVTPDLPDVLFDDFALLRSMNEVEQKSAGDDFILALGLPKHRFALYNKFIGKGFKPLNYLASTSYVSEKSYLALALNVMPFASIFGNASVGLGSLINSYASIHHDVILGEFVTVSPGARVLGRASVGSFTEIGANAVILPDVKVGNGCVIGAGAVVTKDVQDNVLVVGVPGKIIKQL